MSQQQNLPTRLRPIAPLFLLLPGLALAGGKATLIEAGHSMPIGNQMIEAGPTEISLTWQDADTVRMDFDEEGSLFRLEGKTYTVSRSDGEVEVIDIGAMIEMMHSMTHQGKNQEDKDPSDALFSTQATGKTETLAGFKGRVYQVQSNLFDEDEGPDEVVFTDDPLVVEMTHAYFGVMGGMASKETNQSWLDALPGKDRGLLRLGDQLRLESIQRTDPPASVFELPAQPMDLQSQMGSMGAP
ncbi:hypothetical protein [Halomonas piscis]|uniref:hypothetical protein n=1 Tax=Halomonas piscis TaxID=3031727 RepID=UPI00289B8ABE|nr:hypothetical protein [Halomonas piscis]